jgi:hypothetical protein
MVPQAADCTTPFQRRAVACLQQAELTMEMLIAALKPNHYLS